MRIEALAGSQPASSPAGPPACAGGRAALMQPKYNPARRVIPTCLKRQLPLRPPRLVVQVPRAACAHRGTSPRPSPCCLRRRRPWLPPPMRGGRLRPLRKLCPPLQPRVLRGIDEGSVAVVQAAGPGARMRRIWSEPAVFTNAEAAGVTLPLLVRRTRVEPSDTGTSRIGERAGLSHWASAGAKCRNHAAVGGCYPALRGERHSTVNKTVPPVPLPPFSRRLFPKTVPLHGYFVILNCCYTLLLHTSLV